MSSYIYIYIYIFHHLQYSDVCLHVYCNIYNVSADASFDLLQVFPVELMCLLGNLNRTLHFMNGVDCSEEFFQQMSVSITLRAPLDN